MSTTTPKEAAVHEDDAVVDPRAEIREHLQYVQQIHLSAAHGGDLTFVRPYIGAFGERAVLEAVQLVMLWQRHRASNVKPETLERYRRLVSESERAVAATIEQNAPISVVEQARSNLRHAKSKLRAADDADTRMRAVELHNPALFPSTLSRHPARRR